MQRKPTAEETKPSEENQETNGEEGKDCRTESKNTTPKISHLLQNFDHFQSAGSPLDKLERLGQRRVGRLFATPPTRVVDGMIMRLGGIVGLGADRRRGFGILGAGAGWLGII